MGRVYVFVFLAGLMLAIIALISCISADEGDLRGLPRIVWIIIILLFPLIGAIVYLAAGRPVTARAGGQSWRPGNGFPEATRPARPLAPDDDPDFLKAIDRATARADEELLKKWEDDLRQREDDLRKRDKSTDEPPTTDS